MQLPLIPAGLAQDRWIHQLDALRAALDQLDALHETWSATRDNLPAEARPGTPVFDSVLAAHHAECWSYLDDWAVHGHIISEINTAARHAPSPLAPPPATRPVPATGRTPLPVRR
ncbi:hypothetical protein ACWEL8_09715 [Streptomyces sp. NPDC004690]